VPVTIQTETISPHGLDVRIYGDRVLVYAAIYNYGGLYLVLALYDRSYRPVADIYLDFDPNSLRIGLWVFNRKFEFSTDSGRPRLKIRRL
jgi:hypothetical protein